MKAFCLWGKFFVFFLHLYLYVGRVHIFRESLGAWPVVSVNSLTSHATLDGNYKFLDYGPCLQSIEIYQLILSSMIVMICITLYVLSFCCLFLFFDDRVPVFWYHKYLRCVTRWHKIETQFYFLKMILPQTFNISSVTVEEEYMLLVTWPLVLLYSLTIMMETI